MKTILITGATDGIGLQTAIDCAAQGYRVFVHGRTLAKADAACDTICRGLPTAAIHPVAGDLGSLSEVRQLADSVHSATRSLGVLVNNAGVYMNERRVSRDGIELTFAVNHVAHFLLTNLLLDLLRAGSPSRVVTVSSVAHSRGSIAMNDPNLTSSFSPYGAYAQSKLANVLFAYALSRRTTGDHIDSNALHPGVITTKLLRTGFNTTGASVQQGAATSVYLATSDDVRGITGRYFSDRREARSSASTHDTALQDELWEITARMAGLAN